jgi:hypothetical protein
MKGFGNRTVAALVIGGTLVLVGTPASAGVIVTSGELVVEGAKAVDFVTNAPTDFHDSRKPIGAFPYVNSQSVTGDGWSSAADYKFDQSHIDINFNQLRGGSPGGYTQLSGTVNFKADADTTFQITGKLTNDNLGPIAGYGQVRAYLYDVTGGVMLDGMVWDFDMPDGTLELGPQNGDDRNYQGSQTGVLKANHNYMFMYLASNFAYPGNDSGATSTGSFSFNFPGADAVTPEPGVLSMAGVGLLGLVGRRRRR